MPMNAGGDRPKEDDAKAVPLAKTFDSFDATLRLAAMTDQTEDFRDYITQTQKMRAYRGRIEGPLAAKIAAQNSPPPPLPEPPKPPVLRPAPPPMAPRPMPGNAQAAPSGVAANLIVMGAIVALAVAAIALTVMLVVK
jgi:hypothetical protein